MLQENKYSSLPSRTTLLANLAHTKSQQHVSCSPVPQRCDERHHGPEPAHSIVRPPRASQSGTLLLQRLDLLQAIGTYLGKIS